MLHLKSDSDIEQIRAAGRIAAEALLCVQEQLKVGVTTAELDAVAARYIRSQGAKASALGYRGFPKSICISVNDEVVHGIPGERVLVDGDILAVDIAVQKNGFHGDMNATMLLGQVSAEAQRLVDTTRQAMDLGLAISTPEHRLGDIGHVIQAHAEAQG